MPAANAHQFVTNKHRGAKQSHPLRKGEGPIRDTYKPDYYCVENTTSGTYADDNGNIHCILLPESIQLLHHFDMPKIVENNK